MAFVTRLLGAGVTSAGGATTPYSVVSPKLGAIVQNIRFVNAGGSAVTINMFFKPNGGSTVRMLDKDLSVAAGGYVFVEPELTMGQSDAIEVTTSAAMDYLVSGVEKI